MTLSPSTLRSSRPKSEVRWVTNASSSRNEPLSKDALSPPASSKAPAGMLAVGAQPVPAGLGLFLELTQLVQPCRVSHQVSPRRKHAPPGESAPTRTESNRRSL